MKRRHFLFSASTGAAGAAVAWPALVTQAFAQERVPEDGTLAGISDAFRAAQRAGRPLLVLVIPDDNGARWERGSVLGAFLNHAEDDAMAAVGLCEVMAAPMRELRQLVPHAPAGEPLMVLVDTDVVPSRVQAIEPGIPPEPEYPEDMWGTPGRAEAFYAALDARIDSAIVAISGAVTAALASRLGLLDAARRSSARQRAIDTYRAHRVRGSYWASQAGCGVYIEEVPQTGGIGCGMGHTPARAQRFLYFFAPAGNPL
jgi:hypothetical protein